MNRTSKYRDARREYITAIEPISIRSLAPKYERSYSAMARVARMEGWEAERAAYHSRAEHIVATNASTALAERLIHLNDDFLAATEESIKVYRRKLESGEITPTPADVTKLVLTVRDMLAPRKTEEHSDGSVAGLSISEDGLRSLAGAIEAAARGQLAEGGVGTPAEPKLVGSG